MKKRIEVSNESLLKAIEETTTAIGRKIEKHGKDCYISHHETLGVVAEEFDELKDAVRSNDPVDVASELLDVAVGCIFGLASMIEYETSLNKESK